MTTNQTTARGTSTDKLIRELGNRRWSASFHGSRNLTNRIRIATIEGLLEARGLSAEAIAAIR